MLLGKAHQVQTDISDSLFAALEVFAQTRNRNHLDLSGESRSVAVLVVSHRSGILEVRVAAPHPKEKPFFFAEHMRAYAHMRYAGGGHGFRTLEVSLDAHAPIADGTTEIAAPYYSSIKGVHSQSSSL